MERLSGWYSTPDTYAKLVGHEVELRALKKIFPKKSDDELFDMASERIKNVMPTYGVAAPAARALGRLPIGTYALFPSEMIRTTGHTLKYALSDIKEGMSGETKNIKQVIHGMKRLTGLTTTAIGIDAVVNSNNEALGVDRDSQKGLEALKPAWGAGGNPYHMEGVVEGKDGLITTRYVRSTSFDAQDYLKVPLRMIWGRLVSGGDFSEFELSRMMSGMKSSIMGPYTNPKFVYEAIMNVIAEKDRETGKPLRSRYKEDEGWYDIDNAKLIFSELAESIAPGSAQPWMLKDP